MTQQTYTKADLRNALFGQRLERRVFFTHPEVPNFAADIVSLSGKARRQLVKVAEDADTFEQTAALLIATLRVPETNDPLLSEGDRDFLLELPGFVLDAMAEIAMGINGMGVSVRAAIEGAEKNSETTPTSKDGSPSPSGSGE